MATKNFFDLLGDDENEDPFQVVVRANSVSAEVKPVGGGVKKLAPPSRMSTKPAPPAGAVKESQRNRYDGARGGRGGVRGGHGGRRDHGDHDGVLGEGGHRERSYTNGRNVGQDSDGFVGARSLFVEKPVRTGNGEGRSSESGRGGGRGRGRAARGHGEGEDRPPRREFDRHSGNGRGNETDKRAGAGRGNWGSDVDLNLILGTVEAVRDEKASSMEGDAEMKEVSAGSTVEVAPEAVKEEVEDDNEMTLEEYEKVLEEKRKALEAKKSSERKVEVDKAFEKMQLVDNKKREGGIFIKLGQDKERVKKEAAEREEKFRKPVSINEFLKPTEGEEYHGALSNRGRGSRGGRGDRREGGGCADRDSSRCSFGGGSRGSVGGACAPRIEDQAQFPTLGGK